MSLAMLIENDAEDMRALPHILDNFQQNLSGSQTTIGTLTLVNRINDESDWEELVRELEIQGFIVHLVFEPNNSGHDEILYPEADKSAENDPADNGVRALHRFQMQASLIKRKLKQDRKRQALAAREARAKKRILKAGKK